MFYNDVLFELGRGCSYGYTQVYLLIELDFSYDQIEVDI